MENYDKKFYELESRVCLIEKEHKNLKKEISTILGEIKSLKDIELKEIRNILNNRLPLWATSIISILTATVGFLIAKISL